MDAGIADRVKRSNTSKAFLWLKDSHQCLVLIPSASLAGLAVITLASRLETRGTRFIRLQLRLTHPNRHLGRPSQQ